MMNERLDNLRRELVREVGGEAGRSIKGLRWLLLHRRDNLEPDAARRLEHSLHLNQQLQCAYLLKEELGLLWMQPDGRTAWAFLREWAAKAKASGNVIGSDCIHPAVVSPAELRFSVAGCRGHGYIVGASGVWSYHLRKTFASSQKV